jgi:hypothetical protein
MTDYDPRSPQPEPGSSPPAAAPQNSFGIVGFVLGLLGLIFSIIPLIGIVAWPLVILGLVFGGIGLHRARQGRATNKNVAIAGIVCAAIGLIICIIYATVFGVALSDTRKVRDGAVAPAMQHPVIAAERAHPSRTSTLSI